MDRRQFLKDLAAVTAVTHGLPDGVKPGEIAGETRDLATSSDPRSTLGAAPDIDGHTLISEFKIDATMWKVYEDLRTREGAITFVSSKEGVRVLRKSAEATFPGADPAYLGLNLKDIGTTGADLLAERLLLSGGDPDPMMVRSAAPPLGSTSSERSGWKLPWDTIVGTKECFDTMPVFPAGSTRTYHPVQYFPELTNQAARKRFDGLIGGWMPAVRKVVTVSETAYDEIVVFGDVQARDKFIVQTWHRTARVENGKITKVVYGHTYPGFPPRREDPSPEQFYRALAAFTGYWERLLSDFSAASVPENDWIDMSKHAFAKELMVRPGGVYPKYGAVDRDYYGSEYDGFQDMASTVIDNFFSDFVDATGVNNMRGPEIAQFGLTLSLLARHFNYTGDDALLLRHRDKIAATAALLVDLHEESLRLPKDDPGYGLIHGWSESDSCLAPKPMTWWLPYFANNAYSARGLKDIARAWTAVSRSKPSPAMEKMAVDWMERSKVLQDALVASMEKNVRKDMHPPYVGPFPGTALTFWESMQNERPSPQQWAHRAYAELLQADMLPASLANVVIDCMRAYGATTLGVVANVERPHPEGRDILGFISYGYAQMLLRLDRVEEYLLFLYSHRYHDHTRGSWTAGEVAGINGDTALFCIPAQQTIPLLVRWMLVLEDSDEEKLYLAKGVPRDWLASGKEIRIDRAPTRWGRISFRLVAMPAEKSLVASVQLSRPGSPKEVHLKLRLPLENKLVKVRINGWVANLRGPGNDTVLIQTQKESRFEVVGEFN
ncbi:MAG: Tat pathway signal protein [Acidobacteria bacterium]|nr:MAG: Tat pathway signal protein [Acidobacteriota bacterium]